MQHGVSDIPTADELADMADRGEDISRFFTNAGKMKSPARPLQIEFPDGGPPELDEFDPVVLSRDITEYGLRQGDIGAIVHCYTHHAAFDAEFVTGAGATIAVLTLTQADIRPLRRQEILHARELLAA